MIAMRFLAETWCVDVVCIVSKILTLITFGSVCGRAHFRPNRKFQYPGPVLGSKRVTASMLAYTSFKTSPKEALHHTKTRSRVSVLR